jgi:bifunctional non-homologous end joining protein LigD
VARSRSIHATAKIISDSYLAVAQALERLDVDAVLDGELVAFGPTRRVPLSAPTNALRAEATLRYCIFDLMFLKGEDLRDLPLLERKEKLRRIVPKTSAAVV